jgi:alpha-glucosidase (family GH31 glycosyl hydrolase)
MTSVKYWVGIPWMYNRQGWGVALNQPGNGTIDVSQDGLITFSFGCQKQLDLWITTAPSGGTAQDVYSNLAHATGMPSPLPANALFYWQSKSTNQTEATIIEVARTLSQRNLTVGMVVVAHSDIPCATGTGSKDCIPPYYRFDPVRWPDVPKMVSTVTNLLSSKSWPSGAAVMPNLKPTSIATKDCPSCGLLGGSTEGQPTDGDGDDGLIGSLHLGVPTLLVDQTCQAVSV